MCKKSLLFMLLFALIAPWAANAQNQLNEGFEGTTFPPEDWTAIHVSGTQAWTRGTGTGNNSSSAYAYRKDVSGGYEDYLITPQLVPATGEELSFYLASQFSANYAGTTLTIEVSTTTPEIASFTNVIATYTSGASGTFGTSSSSDWVNKTVDVSAYVGQQIYIAFHAKDTGYNADVRIDDVTGVSVYVPACPKPTGLALATDGETVTATWAGSASSYNIDVNGSVTTGVTSPYTFRAELSTTYTVKVQANCGTNGTSEWTNPVSITTPACVGGHEIEYTLTDSYGDGWNGASITVIAGCEELTTLTVSSSSTSGTLTICEDYFTFIWNSGYYDSECGFTFTENGTTLFTKPSSLTDGQVLYTFGTTTPKPTDLTAGHLATTSAVLSWEENGDAEAWQICVNGDETNLIDVTEYPYTLTGLAENTSYTVKVRAYVDATTQSCWSDEETFTTLALCPAPTNFAVDEASITDASASFSWDSDNNNFELRYAKVEGTLYDFDDSSLGDWTNIDADGDGYVWVVGADAAGVYHNEGVDVTGNGHNDSHDFVISGSYSNFAGEALTPDNYLVSPRIALGGFITFWAQAQDASYPAEHFGVAVSTSGNTSASDFTTIQEWTMTAKSSIKANPSTTRSGENLRAGTWYQYTVDLSAYSGQGYVAIRHFNCTDQFLLNVDDITIVPELSWTTVNNITASPYTLTGLDENSTYMAQVRSICTEGNSDWSSFVTFTTLPSCLVPLNLAVSNVTAHTATLTWEANDETETAWQVCINDGTPIDVTETTYAMTNLPEQTTYTVKVRTNCGESGYSEWTGAITFTTDIACYAPEGLAVNDITTNSAVASWTSGANSCDLRYAVLPANRSNGWLAYDNGEYETSIGSSTSGTRTWGVMYPASMLDANTVLSKVSIYENSYNTGDITITIMQGGDEAPETMLYTETVTPVGAGFHEITLAEPVTINPGENLWIALTETGTYVMNSCISNEPNNQWAYSSSMGWYNLIEYNAPNLDGFGWMIRAYVETDYNPETLDWTEAYNLTEYEYEMTDLTPATRYIVQVRSNCDEEGYSVWKTYTFETESLCATPEITEVTNVDATSATVNWTGMQESFNVKYGALETLAFINFEDGVIPTDWVNDETYPWIVTDTVATNPGHCLISGNQGISSSSSTISVTATFSDDGFISFDAMFRGEGTSSIWDKCIFSIDGEAQFTYGAIGEEWYYMYYEVEAGEHTFTWSYSKDSSVDNPGDSFYIDNVIMATNNITWAPIVEGVTGSSYNMTNLTSGTIYVVQVQGINATCEDGVTEWSDEYAFITDILVGQTIELTEGWNWISTYIDLNEVNGIQLLEEALGDYATEIQSFGDGAEYFGNGEWVGLDDYEWTNAEMVMVNVTEDCTITLAGPAVDPSTVEIEIYPEWNWIGFPVATETAIEVAMGDFEPIDEDIIASSTEGYDYLGEWIDIETLVPGQGYMYYSNSTETKTLVFQAGAKKARSSVKPIKVMKPMMVKELEAKIK